MSNQNQAQKATITKIKDKFFKIPEYQRLYEWESTHIETLLDDMKKACDSGQQYFIGNITTSIDKNDSNKFILIDGQQRLTTLWFIGFYLASKECDEWQQKWKEFILKDDKLRIAMPIRENEEKALKELANNITGKENLAQSLLSKDIYQNIFNAFKCIESWFVGENNKDIELAKFAKYIYESVCFVFVELEENTDLNRFFVRMNNRGKQLEKHEILKAQILDKIKDDKEWQKYAKIWDLCSDMNKYIFQSASDINIFEKENKNDSTTDKVESIIDFPTFLLHCYKLYSQDNSVPITQDKLLKNFNLSKMDSGSCKIFIKSMLYYRVLFDYFVIKNTLSDDGFAIMRLYENKGTYQAKSKVFTQLTMTQNYLRVARQGERQNYHHWLTPFLKYLSEDNDNKSIKKYLDLESWNPNKICEKFVNRFEKLSEVQQSKFSSFLEDLDSKLAIYQIGAKSENGMLDITNSVIMDLNVILNRDELNLIENFNILEKCDFLNNGTETPHYWFYRLEYYLWKNKQKFADIKFSGQSFESVADKFYFRNLNSVEHIQPQSRAVGNGWEIHNKGTKDEKRDIDYFGNLALLSVGFNSSLSNQDNADKRLDLQKKINKSEVESLKLWLVFAQYIKEGNEWTHKNAQEHQEQMIDILIESLKD